MRRPLAAAWLAGWVLILAALALFAPWQQADWLLYEATSRQKAPPWPSDLIVIDVPHHTDVGRFRGRITQLCELLASEPLAAPRAVVFDVHFGPRSEGLPELTDTLRRLQATGTKLFAAVDPRHPSSAMPWPGYMAEHARPLYEAVLDGMGHTLFDQHGGVFKYDPRLELGAGVRLSSLVIKVAEEEYQRPLDAQEQPILLHLGPAEVLRAHAWRFEDGRFVALGGNSALDFRQRVVIVGSLDQDRFPGAQASGPEFVAWAIAARAARADTAEARLLANSPLLLGVTVALGILTAAVAWWTYRLVAGAPRRMLWTCGSAFLLPALALLASVASLRAAGLVLGQVTLPLLGIVVAGLLCAAFAWRYRLWAAVHARSPVDVSAYDVFVSYSRSDPAHVEWVREHVVVPLRDMTHPEGRKLRVFFDTHEIKVGDNWFDRLLNAVGTSRCFLPVYSADYHAKHFCAYELTAAIKRHIQGKMEIVPVRCGSATIPKAAEGVQCVAAEAPDFIQRVASKLDSVWRSDLRDELSQDVRRAAQR